MGSWNMCCLKWEKLKAWGAGLCTFKSVCSHSAWEGLRQRPHWIDSSTSPGNLGNRGWGGWWCDRTVLPHITATFFFPRATTASARSRKDYRGRNRNLTLKSLSQNSSGPDWVNCAFTPCGQVGADSDLSCAVWWPGQPAGSAPV